MMRKNLFNNLFLQTCFCKMIINKNKLEIKIYWLLKENKKINMYLKDSIKQHLHSLSGIKRLKIMILRILNWYQIMRIKICKYCNKEFQFKWKIKMYFKGMKYFKRIIKIILLKLIKLIIQMCQMNKNIFLKIV
jgi:hypothetical protein